ncbi:MAG: FkbM family methyltransferase [Planctomycetota bacterium]|nr:FkbM family methyltransferase [Planctomycetota bacterium]
MRYFSKLRRRLQKTFFPNEWDVVIRRWKTDKGDQTLRLDYNLNAGSVVLDLGGYCGEWADNIHARYGCKVHVFEPVASFADGIANRFCNNDAIEVHRFGLGGSTRSESIGLSADGSSVFQLNGQTEAIQIVDVVAWIQQQAASQFGLMKINIEGGEYEVLERLLDAGLISRIEDIQVQFHNIAPDSETRMNSILQRLEGSHLPTYRYPFVWENWRRRAA